MLSLYSGDKNEEEDYEEEDYEEGIYIHCYRPAGRVFNYGIKEVGSWNNWRPNGESNPGYRCERRI